MSTIAVFNGQYCNEKAIIEEIMIRTGYELVDDKLIAADAEALSGMPKNRIERAFSARASVFNKFTHERESAVANLKLALSRRLKADRLLVWGHAMHLIPKEISHVLRVCLIADSRYRSARAVAAGDATQNDALKVVRHADESRAAWVHFVTRHTDPWDSTLYDMVLPPDKLAPDAIATMLLESLQKPPLQVTPASLQAMADFELLAQVEVVLAKAGHNVTVEAKSGSVTLTINHHVLMLQRLENDLKSLVAPIPGVLSVETQTGPGFYQSDIYRKFEFQAPSKILLVDDEREFVETLSERLYMRDLGSAVAYDGESALEVVKEDEPEVMILDLRMPGIDGIEVLRKVKDEHPEIEVIILTGHGSEADRETCMDLGAFAYLQKPVEIDVLSRTIRDANEAIRKKRSSGK